MAFFSTVRLLIKREAFNSEVLLKSLNYKPNISMTDLATQYIQSLRQVKFKSEADASDYFNFPHNTFHNLPMKFIIEESFNIIKESEFIKSPRIFVKLLGAHLLYDIDIDINKVLNEMKEKQIEINDILYNVIIKYLSLHGQMVKMESVLNAMESENVQLSDVSKFSIISGYTISGETEKLKDFIIKNQMDENCDDVMYAKLEGYGYKGDIESAKNIINKMKEEKSHLDSNHLWILYRNLIKVKVPEIQLQQIIDMTKNIQTLDGIFCLNIILNLARNEYFTNSTVKLIENFLGCFKDKPNILIMTFRKPSCPMDIYKNILKLLLDGCVKHKDVNLFLYMAFDDALEFANATVNQTNFKTVSFSLANKALEDKSSSSIETSLDFFKKHLTNRDINHYLQFKFIPVLLSSRFADNCEDILDLFHNHRKMLFSPILMYYLCQRDFQTFNKLLKKRKFISTLVSYNTNWTYTSREMMDIFSFQDIEKLKEEAGKVFNEITVTSLVANFLMRKIELLSKSNDLDEIKKWIKFIKKHNITFRDFEIDILSSLPPNHRELLKSNGVFL